MADELTLALALQFAKALKSIPKFSFDEAVILAAAGDLMRWCKGAIVAGIPWSAENQASYLVTYARENWDEWQGTAALHRIFCAKFEPEPAPERQIFDMGERPPVTCQICKDAGTLNGGYCSCVLGQEMKATWGNSGLAEIFHSKSMQHRGPKTRPTPLFVSEEEVRAAEEEYRRKKSQVQ